MLAYLSSRKLPARSSNILLDSFVRANWVSASSQLAFIATTWVCSSRSFCLKLWWLIYNQSWEERRTESTSPSAVKKFLLPSVNLFSITMISLRRYFRAFIADSPGIDSANVVGTHEASVKSFKTSFTSSSTTTCVSLLFGVAYKLETMESVARACRVSSSSKVVLRTLYNL